ncbi:MAG: metallophosphoesterase [Clostridia bacterium]|nr:metallophosphoesterase [Clostridia bacterium]
MATNLFHQLLFRLITAVFAAVFALTSGVPALSRALPQTPDDFTPVLRFAVTSDVHLNGDPDQPAAQRLAVLLQDSYAYAQGERYAALDALIVAGDFATTGDEAEYQLFNSIMARELRPETQLLTMLGNHEFIKYRDEDPTVAYDVYRALVHEDVDRHLVINGYHFIACSYAPDGKTFTEKKPWLTAQLDAACADTPDRPVFVFQHPHPFATVYGSVNWSDFTVRTVLEHYPQAVDFSGHSHYAPCDPRCIWQGAFTAVNTGSLSALMGNLDYISGDEDAPGDSAAFWICEADAQGNVRLKLYDAVSRRFFEKTDYYLPNPAEKRNHCYTWSTLQALDTAPAFPAGAQITAAQTDGRTVLVFPNAEGYWGAEDYKITVRNGAREAFAATVISNYVRADATEMRVDVGALDAGTYTVTIRPYSPYAKGGKALTGSITVPQAS